MTQNSNSRLRCGCVPHPHNTCMACQKCDDHCKCTQGGRELFRGLAVNQVSVALQEKANERADELRERAQPTTKVPKCEQGGSRAKKGFRLGRS